MKQLFLLVCTLACVVGCTSAKVGSSVDDVHAKATIEYWMNLHQIGIAWFNAKEPYESQFAEVKGNTFIKLTNSKPISRQLATISQTALLQCNSLSHRNVDKEAIEVGEAWMAHLKAESDAFEFLSKLDLSRMVNEALGELGAELLDSLCTGIAQLKQSLKGNSPAPRVNTPLSDLASSGNITEKMDMHINRVKDTQASLMEIERKSRRVLSERYNVAFPPL